jgi:hypothetical protein
MRAATFVAIVWAIAASFVVFDLVALGGFGLLLDTSAGRELALSDTVRNSRSCLPLGPPTAPAVSNADASAWVLGLMAGTHALTSRWVPDVSSGTPGAQRPQWQVLAEQRATQAAANVEKLAADLKVPKPAAFHGGKRGNANTAYMIMVEEDPTETARRIAENYGEANCHLYKLGAYWGYAAEVRIALPGERSIFGLEIEYHARKARLPEELWAPALRATASDATTDELVRETGAMTLAVTQHLLQSVVPRDRPPDDRR